MVLVEEILDLATAEGEMGVIAKRPDGGGPFPVVVLFHDGPGVREATHEVVRRIAAPGFYVLAPDRYHRRGRFVHVPPEDLMAAGPDSELVRDFFQLVLATTDDHVRADVASLLGHLASDPAARRGPMGCLGYCNGVRAVLSAMADHPDTFAAGVGLHPSFCVESDDGSPHRRIAATRGAFYFAFGGADHVAPVEDNRPLIDALVKLGGRATIDIFPGADHGFAMPGPTYQKEAAAQAYARALALFKRVLT